MDDCLSQQLLPNIGKRLQSYGLNYKTMLDFRKKSGLFGIYYLVNHAIPKKKVMMCGEKSVLK
jgi:hypothetical protein